MGNGDSKEQHDSSASYANADEETVEDVPSLYTGPIHSLCVVDEERLLSGGADKASLPLTIVPPTTLKYPGTCFSEQTAAA